MSRISLWERLQTVEKSVEKLLARSYLPYYKGSFTPTLIGATTPGTTTYSVQVGRYVRVGQITVATGRLTWTAVTGTGIAIYGGLPFSSYNVTNLRHPPTLWISAVTFAGSFVGALLAENSGAWSTYTIASNVASTQLNIEAAGDIAFTFVYLSQ